MDPPPLLSLSLSPFETKYFAVHGFFFNERNESILTYSPSNHKIELVLSFHPIGAKS